MTGSPLSQLNSALDLKLPDGAYVHVLKYSTKSYKDAINTANISGYDGMLDTLDTMHSKIGTYSSGINQVLITGAYQVILSKTNDKNYSGIILTPRMSYMEINAQEKYGLPIFFAYFNNDQDDKFSLLIPVRIQEQVNAT